MPRYTYEPTEKYLCRYCNKECGVKGFNSHLTLHKIKFKDYMNIFIDEYPEDFINFHRCPICKVNITKKGNGKRLGTCSVVCRSQSQSQHQQGRNIWKEMSPETKQNAQKKIAEKATIRSKGRNIWAEMDNETSKNAKQKISIATGLRVKGSGNPMFGKTHTSEAIKKILTKRPQTSIEQIISNFLDDEKIEYYFQFFINDTSTHSYDFKIKGIPLIIELDGDYWHGGPGCVKHFFDVETTKLTDAIKTEIALKNNMTVIRFWESEIKNNLNDVKTKILTEINKYKLGNTK